MKKKIIFAVAIMVTFLSACKKKNDPTTPDDNNNITSTPITVLAQDSTYDSSPSNTKVRVYKYNKAKKLYKIEYYYGTPSSYGGYDSIIYNASGMVSQVMAYGGSSTLTDIVNYTYSASNLMSVISSSDTILLQYTSGKISTVYTYTNTRDTLSGIVYTGKNISSGFYDGTPVTANSDVTAANPYYGIPFSSLDFLNLLDKNNPTTIYPTAVPSNKFQDNSYVYSSGRVSQIIDNGNVRTTDLKYKKI